MATSESSSTPSSRKSKIGAKLVMENAERHYRCANHLHEICEFGMAQSHLVLSLEEAIKSVFLYFKGLGIPIRQNILSDLLKKHKPRLEIGGGSYFLIGLVVWVVSSLTTAMEDAKGKTDRERKLIRKKTMKRIIDELNKSAESESNDTEFNRVVLPALIWWKAANEKKKAGFYADFQNGNWYSPNMISKEDYLQSVEIANNVIRNIRVFYEIIESLSEKEQSEIVNELKSKYKKVIKAYKSGRGGEKQSCKNSKP